MQWRVGPAGRGCGGGAVGHAKSPVFSATGERGRPTPHSSPGRGEGCAQAGAGGLEAARLIPVSCGLCLVVLLRKGRWCGVFWQRVGKGRAGPRQRLADCRLPTFGRLAFFRGGGGEGEGTGVAAKLVATGSTRDRHLTQQRCRRPPAFLGTRAPSRPPEVARTGPSRAPRAGPGESPGKLPPLDRPSGGAGARPPPLSAPFAAPRAPRFLVRGFASGGGRCDGKGPRAEGPAGAGPGRGRHAAGAGTGRRGRGAGGGGGAFGR